MSSSLQNDTESSLHDIEAMNEYLESLLDKYETVGNEEERKKAQAQTSKSNTPLRLMLVSALLASGFAAAHQLGFGSFKVTSYMLLGAAYVTGLWSIFRGR